MDFAIIIYAIVTSAILLGGALLVGRLEKKDSEYASVGYYLFLMLSTVLIAAGSALFVYSFLHERTVDLCIEPCDNCYKAIGWMWVIPLLAAGSTIMLKRAGRPLLAIGILLSVITVAESIAGYIYLEKRMGLTRDHYLHSGGEMKNGRIEIK